METLIWTDPGLGHYYICNWTLGQILPRRRKEGCQQSLTECSVKERHGSTMRETLPWKNTHMRLPKWNQAIWTPSPVHGPCANTSVWSEPSSLRDTAHLGIGTPRRWHPLSTGPNSAWRQPSLFADLRAKQ